MNYHVYQEAKFRSITLEIETRLFHCHLSKVANLTNYHHAMPTTDEEKMSLALRGDSSVQL